MPTRVMMSPAATMKLAAIVCGNAARATGFVSSAPMSTSSARPFSSLIWKPTGFCMNAFAAMMK